MPYEIMATPEGVEALRSLGDALLDELDTIDGLDKALSSTYQEVSSMVAHEDDIEDILEGVRVTSAGASSDLATLSRNAKKMANRLDEFLQARLGGSGN